MIYEIQGQIITNNNGIRNAVYAILPDEGDPKFHGGIGAEYDLQDFTNEDDFKVIMFQYVYSTEVDRNAFYASMSGLAGIINACEPGSYVTKIGRNHDVTPVVSGCVNQGGISS